jgi:hypothetical protein
MDTPVLIPPAPSIDPPTLRPPSKTSKTGSKKLKAQELIAQIPPRESVTFEPLKMNSPSPPILHLPHGVDIKEPLALFSLFINDELWEIVAQNTNTYAEVKRRGKEEHTRPWTPTYASEIKVFIGILIYMGVHKEPRIEHYWRRDLTKGPLHTIPLHMSLVRFEQLKRYLHISRIELVDIPSIPRHLNVEPTYENEHTYGEELLGQIWWHKLDPMISQFRNASEKYYTSSSNISIDELMIRCFGRSQHTYKMPNKPISQGYKLFALADHGYIWSFTPTSRAKHLVEVVMHKHDMLTMTGSMVNWLVNRLPPSSNRYTLYLDNYCTSISLFEILRNQGIGACGTTRPTAAGPDFPILIQQLRDHASYIPWNTICAIEVRKVLCLAWQDNNLVLGLSTVHTVDKSTDLIERDRKRPSKTSTNAAQVRPIFGDSHTKKLFIPNYIDDYNHHMGGVDIANQLRESYETHRRTFRSWWPLFMWLIDAAAVNAYRISCADREMHNKARISQLEFRQSLYLSLFAFSQSKPQKRKAQSVDLPLCRFDTSLQHIPVQRPPKLATRCSPRTGRSCFQSFHLSTGEGLED